MERIFEFTVRPDELPCTLGEYLRARGFSRQIIIHLKKTPMGIQVNGQWAYVRTVLQAGDLVTIHLSETEFSEKIPPVPMELDILYEDQDILVVNKPADTPVHPSLHNYENTLANGIAWYFQQKGEPFVFRCINRLDRDTTGLLILGKNAYSASVLSSRMKKREIRRTYLGAARGIPQPPEGTVTAPIAREKDSAILRCVDFQRGEEAVTHYKTLCTEKGSSLIRFSLETGRTHQIRVHMKYLGTPLLGDYLYNPEYSKIKRVALHSYSLEFRHPVTNEELYFQSPLPKDMAELFPSF
ncbi:MAG: RluA family pseudouridine synthase [Clostridiales bacterium]|nr:RluA family pseudouridine synthase [Clostridiales bacterium]